MNLFNHVQTVKRWIRSCEKAEQLDLCAEVIQEFILKRFEGLIPAWELDEAKTDLSTTLNDRRIMVAIIPMPDADTELP